METRVKERGGGDTEAKFLDVLRGENLFLEPRMESIANITCAQY
jgi:hypothetical protein